MALDPLRRSALSRVGADFPPDPDAGIGVAANPEPFKFDAYAGTGLEGPDDEAPPSPGPLAPPSPSRIGQGGSGPEVSTPAANPETEQLRALAKQSLRQRLIDALAGPDVKGLQDAMRQGQLRAEGADIGGAFDRAQVGQFHGGNSDPATFMAILSRGNQNAINNASDRAQQLENQPVQAYVQMQAQKRLGMDEARRATEELTKLANEERLERGKTGKVYTPQEIEAAKARFKAKFPNAPQDLIDAINPETEITYAKLLQRGDDAQARALAAQQAQEFRHGENEANRDLRKVGLGIAEENVGARKDYNKIRATAVGQSGQRLAQSQGEKIMAGYELDQPLQGGVQKELQKATEYSRATINLLNKFEKEYGDTSLWEKLAPTEQQAKLNLLHRQLLPYLNASEMNGQFTVGHARNLMDQVKDPLKFAQLVNEGRVPAMLHELKITLPATLYSRAEAVGAHPLNTLEEPVRPGRIKSAPPGTPGSKTYVPGSYSQVPGMETGPSAVPQGVQMFKVTDKTTGKSKPVDASQVGVFQADKDFTVEPL